MYIYELFCLLSTEENYKNSETQAKRKEMKKKQQKKSTTKRNARTNKY